MHTEPTPAAGLSAKACGWSRFCMHFDVPSVTHVIMLGHHIRTKKNLGRLLVTRQQLCSDALTINSTL